MKMKMKKNFLIGLFLGFAMLLMPVIVSADLLDLTLEVDSRYGMDNGMFNTGIKLEVGDLLNITADQTDLWSNHWGAPNNFTADGTWVGHGGPSGTTTYNGHTADRMSLVGYIGGDYFTIGFDYSGTVENGGTLYLMAWDDICLYDNVGSVTTNIQAGTAPVPEPGTMVLMGLGLVGLAGVSRKKMMKK